LEFKQESQSKTLKCFGVGAESEYIQPKQVRCRSQKFQTPYTSGVYFVLWGKKTAEVMKLFCL